MKLGIIGAILLVAVIVFPNEIYQLFPETSSNVKNDLEKIKDDAIQKTGATIGEGGKIVNNQVKDLAKSSTEIIFDSISESISESISDANESIQQTVGFAGILGDDQTSNDESQSQRDSSYKPNNGESSSFSTVVTGEKTIQTFDTLSLESSQQSDGPIYSDLEEIKAVK